MTATAAASAAWRLHLENVQLRHKLRHTPKQIRCVYCAAPTQRKSRVCAAHKDLPPIDAGYHG